MVVHHMYSKWKKEHPEGTMQDFITDNRDRLPPGWEGRLNGAGDINLKAGQR